MKNYLSLLEHKNNLIEKIYKERDPDKLYHLNIRYHQLCMWIKQSKE